MMTTQCNICHSAPCDSNSDICQTCDVAIMDMHYDHVEHYDRNSDYRHDANAAPCECCNENSNADQFANDVGPALDLHMCDSCADDFTQDLEAREAWSRETLEMYDR